MQNKISRFLELWKERGFGYAWNYAKFHLMWDTLAFQKIYFEWLKLKPDMPKFIEVETTTYCPLKCIMCEHTYWDEPSRNMSFEQFKSIIDQFPELWWIGLTGIGESFLNPDFMKILRYTREKFPNIFIELYDNLYFVNENEMKELISLPIDRLLISTEAATKKTYENIRKGAKFEKAEENIKKFIKLRGDRTFPQIHFHYIVLKQNVNEIPLFVEKVNEWCEGKDSIIEFRKVLHPFKEIRDICMPEIPQKIVNEAEKSAEKYGIKIGWSKDVPINKPPVKKCYEWSMPFIFVTGDITPCCSLNENNKRDRQKRFALGNVFEKPFKEIWEGKRYKNMLEAIRNNEVPPVCKNCPLYDVGRS